MASLFDNKQNIQEENSGNKIGFIVVTLFLIWLFFPNNNSFIKLSYWANNFFYNVLKILKINNTPEYVHYRNNAVYLAKVYPKKSTPALNEIDKAIALVPENLNSNVTDRLRNESALIRLYYGDKSGALNDYLAAKEHDKTDKLRIAVLLTGESRYAEAANFCNNLLSSDSGTISGYVCLAYVYEKTGDIESANRIYDTLLELKPKSDVVYMERSFFRERIGDKEGQQEDIKKAKALSSSLLENQISIIDNALNIKELSLPII